MRALPIWVLAVTLSATAAIAMACGSSADSASLTSEAHKGRRALQVDMRDNLFEPKRLTVKAGEPLVITLRNRGVEPHNMRVAGMDGRYNTADDLVSQPEMQMTGMVGTLELILDRPGTYQFRCDFHAAGMLGVITVTP